jgi:amino acid adenylation domain-containing protein
MSRNGTGLARAGAAEATEISGATIEAMIDATIDDLFRACVRQLADRPAVTSRGRTLTYAELDRRVDALARRLVGAGLERGARVAFWLEPSIDVVVAMLGALRAGAAYLPIDGDQPVDRVRYLLDDSGAAVLIARGDAAASLSFAGLTIDLAQPGELDAGSGEPVSLPAITARDCAYLIYTSGTTGRPKGVLIEHRSLVHYVTSFRQRYGIDTTHTAALLTSHAFDLGYTALWTTLLCGGQLHLVPEALRSDIPATVRYLGEHRISFLKVTPWLLSALLSSSAFIAERCGALRLVVSGGERIRPRDLERLYARFPDVLAVNHYGPTETTIGVVTHPIERAALADFARRPVIGRPMGATTAYVVTPDLQLVSVGEVGELLIGGPGVGRGYHGRAELTREKFLPDHFGLRPQAGRSEGDELVYRTGDLARWTPEGTLELLGRVDRQLKIRGHRVEPAEIEQVVLAWFDVQAAVVVVRSLDSSLDRSLDGSLDSSLDRSRSEGSNLVLCLYYVAQTALATSQVRARLAEALPEYMVPAVCILVPAIPRSANGKLDVERLPAPNLALGDALGETIVAPDGGTERVLLALWSSLLGLPAEMIGVARNFFELGGHSLLMIQLIAEIEDVFGVEVPVPAFFAEGTVRAIAQEIDRLASAPQSRPRAAIARSRSASQVGRSWRSVRSSRSGLGGGS